MGQVLELEGVLDERLGLALTKLHTSLLDAIRIGGPEDAAFTEWLANNTSALRDFEEIIDDLDFFNRSGSESGQHFTPLTCAADAGDATATAWLIERGVDLNIKDKYNCTPLRRASLQGHDQIVLLLLRAGATADSADDQSALLGACITGKLGCVQLMLAYGADKDRQHCDDLLKWSKVNASIRDWLVATRHWTPLHYIEWISPERACALIRRCDDIDRLLNHRPNDDASALQRARELEANKMSGECGAVASLIVLAAGPWRTKSHFLFPDAQRALIRSLLGSLYHLFLRRMSNGGWQAVDFSCHVLSLLDIRRQSTGNEHFACTNHRV